MQAIYDLQEILREDPGSNERAIWDIWEIVSGIKELWKFRQRRDETFILLSQTIEEECHASSN